MYDEPFDYSLVDEQVPEVSLKPGVRVLERCLPSNANPFIAVEYTLPESNYSQLEILNENGDRLETLINGYRHKGAHCAVWHIQQRNSGKYYCRFRAGDFTDTSEFMLRKS